MNSAAKTNVEEPVVIFVHISKTAGTTLRRVIQHQFQPHEIFEFYRDKRKEPQVGINKFNELSENRKGAIKFISGHIGFGVHEFLQRPYTYITVLRNPIDRVVSQYYFLLTKKNFKEQNKTFEEFLQTEIRGRNLMTLYLSGALLKNKLYSSNTGVNYLKCTDETLKLAKSNLKNYFKVVGLLEKFSETCILLKQILGWDIPPFYGKSNVCKNRPLTSDLSKNTLRLIETSNEFDIQLYDYAKEIFDAQVSSQGSFFQEAVSSLNRVNNLSSLAKFNYTLASSYKRVSFRLHEVLTKQ